MRPSRECRLMMERGPVQDQPLRGMPYAGSRQCRPRPSDPHVMNRLRGQGLLRVQLPSLWSWWAQAVLLEVVLGARPTRDRFDRAWPTSERNVGRGRRVITVEGHHMNRHISTLVIAVVLGLAAT